jgi:hypothetical protein
MTGAGRGATEAGIRLPDRFVDLLDGSRLEDKEGATLIVTSVDEDGWPHVAMLSVGELLACSPSVLRLALHASSGTTANLARTGRATLLWVDGGTAFTLRLDLSALGPLTIGGLDLCCFEGRALHVREHRVPYAELVSGVRFRLKEPESTMVRWRETLSRLRSLEAGAD